MPLFFFRQAFLFLFAASILVAADSPRLPATKDITLKLERSNLKQQHNFLILEAVFTNNSDKAVKIITPQDGSMVGWLSPKYLIREKSGNLGGIGRCGNHGGAYDEKTIKEIAPGAILTIPVYTPYQLTKPGKYQITLTYEVEAKKYPGPRYDAPSIEPVRWKEWPRGVFVGSIKSNELEIQVPASR